MNSKITGFDSRKFANFYVFGIYLVLSALLTWPMVFKMGSVLFGDYGDSRGGVWWLWARANGFMKGPVNHLIAAPIGIPTAQGFSQPVLDLIYASASFFFNEIVSYNLVIFLAFPLTAFAMYWFLKTNIASRFAAIIGGVIFGFCPAAVMQAVGGHSAYSLNMFIPIFMMTLLNHHRKHSAESSCFMGGAFALVTLTALNIGYFVIYVGLAFMIFDLIQGDSKQRSKIAFTYLLAVGVASVIILPFEYRAILEQVIGSHNKLAQAGHIRDMNELVIYSARVWDFIVPSIDHPILGRWLVNFVREHLHGSNVPEQTLFLGFVPIALALSGIWLVIQGKILSEQRTLCTIFIFGLFLMIFLSLPPLINIGEYAVPTVSYFAYKVAPMFRVYSRFGILANFFLACICAVVIAHFEATLSKNKFYFGAVLLVPIFIFEYWSLSPGYSLDVRTPMIYSWLAEQPGNGLVAEYPMTSGDDFAFYTYLFWQRIHKKPLVNGATQANPQAWEIFGHVNDLERPGAFVMLRDLGVKYIVVHQAMYGEGLIPDPLKKYYSPLSASIKHNDGRVPVIPASLKLEKAFGRDLVFSIEPTSRSLEK